MITKVSAASEDIALGDASTNAVGRIVFNVKGTSWTGTLIPKARVRGSGHTLVAVPYINRATGSTIAAGTTITADGLYEVDATGVEIVLTHALTGTSVEIAYLPVAG